jgi:hypothetical protein
MKFMAAARSTKGFPRHSLIHRFQANRAIFIMLLEGSMSATIPIDRDSVIGQSAHKLSISGTSDFIKAFSEYAKRLMISVELRIMDVSESIPRH